MALAALRLRARKRSRNKLTGEPDGILNDDGALVPFHHAQQMAWDSTARTVIMCAGSQGGKCLDPESLVLLADGRRQRARDIKAGDVVLCLGADLKITTSKVVASFSTGIQPGLRITTVRGRSLIVTKEHPLLGAEGWSPAGNLREGSFIGIPRRYPDLGKKRGDAKWSRLLGYLLGDGSFRGGAKFTNQNAEILIDVARCLPEGVSLVYQGRYDYRLSVGKSGGHKGNPVCQQLKKEGVWDKLSIEKHVPESVFELSLKGIGQLLNGLLATDGWVDTKGVGFASSSEQLLDDVAHLFLRFGIVANKRHKIARCNGKGFDTWSLAINDLDDLITIAVQIGIISKQTKLEKLIARKSGHRTNGKDIIPNFPIAECYAALGPLQRRWKARFHADSEGYRLLRRARRACVSRSVAQEISDHFQLGGDKAYSDIYWDKVASIEPVAPMEMWDLSLEEGHNFIANDIFAHNTAVAPVWLWREIQRCGGGDYLAATASYGLFNQKFLPSFLRYFEDYLGIGRYWTGNRIIEIADPETGHFLAERSTDTMWARIILGSAQAPNALESATAKAAVLDEAGMDDFSLRAFQAILRRLHIHRGRRLIGTTLYNAGWFVQQLINPIIKDGVEHSFYEGEGEITQTINERLDSELIQFDSTINPLFSVEEFRLAQDTLEPAEFAMFYRGRVGKPRTLIYDCFDERIHKVRSFPIPSNWPRFVGIDPTGAYVAALWLAYDRDRSQLHIYREYYEPFGITTPGHVQNILSLGASEPILAYVGGGPSERQQRADWTGSGLPLIPAPFADVWVGIGRVYALFKTNGLVVHDCCENLLDEIGRMQTKKDALGNPTRDIQYKDTMHASDCLRYITAWLTEPDETHEAVYRPAIITTHY